VQYPGGDRKLRSKKKENKLNSYSKRLGKNRKEKIKKKKKKVNVILYVVFNLL